MRFLATLGRIIVVAVPLVGLATCSTSVGISSPPVTPPYYHGTIVGRTGSHMFVVGDSLSRGTLYPGFSEVDFTLGSYTTVWEVSAGGADTSALKVGRVVWVHSGSGAFDSLPPQTGANEVWVQ